MSMEPETQPTEPQEEVVDQPVVEAVKVPARAKRPMSDDALARLALAREKALAVRQMKAREKLLEKASAMLPSSVPSDPNKRKKKREPPQVVIEASDSDSDEYESPQIVVVKKKRAPKKMKEEKENSQPSSSREVEQKKQEPSLEELIARTFVRI